MSAKAAQAQAASDHRLAELLAKCGPVWVPAEDQGHLRAMAARDAALARDAIAVAYCRLGEARDSDGYPL